LNILIDNFKTKKYPILKAIQKHESHLLGYNGDFTQDRIINFHPFGQNILITNKYSYEYNFNAIPLRYSKLGDLING